FVKSFLAQPQALLFGGGQDIFYATARNPDGTFTWTPFASTTVGGVLPKPIHPDLWDLLIAPDGQTTWLAGDGGIHELQAGGQWVNNVSNMHTHHAHTLTLLPTHVVPSPLGYPTGDNDAWNSATQIPATWRTTNCRDVNSSAGDAGNPRLALLWRQPNC